MPMKAAVRKPSEMEDPFEIDDGKFLIGYRFLGILPRKSRRVAKTVAKRKSKTSVASKRLKKG
jgi:hypothetical protein